MSKHNKMRMFLYKTANRLRGLYNEDYATEIDVIIDEIRRKNLDDLGNFKQLIVWLESTKKEALFKPKSKTRQFDPFEIPMSGIGRIVLFGLSNVGKSTLMNAITNTEVATGAYLHTTTVGQAGACTFENVTFQIVDLPGFLEFKEDWALSKQIVRVARTGDVIMLVIDLTMDIENQLTFLTEQLESAKILVDGDSSLKIAIIATKGDLPGSKENYQKLLERTSWEVFPTAYNNEKSLEELKKKMFYQLEVIRIYTKPSGEKPNLKKPFIAPLGATVADITEKIHSSFLQRFRYAKVWGTSVDFSGQQVGLDHELHDEDILELVLHKQLTKTAM